MFIVTFTAKTVKEYNYFRLSGYLQGFLQAVKSTVNKKRQRPNKHKRTS